MAKHKKHKRRDTRRKRNKKKAKLDDQLCNTRTAEVTIAIKRKVS